MSFNDTNTTANVRTSALIEAQTYHKSILTTYLLLIFVGQLGIHRFYTGFKKVALAILGATVVGWLLVIVGLVSAAATGEGGAAIPLILGWVLLVAVGLFLLVELFLTPSVVREANTLINEKFITRRTAAGANHSVKDTFGVDYNN